jgi:hypothetical protein
LLERLERETDKGLQMAYASALGKLQAKESTGTLLALLNSFENEGARLELALSVARLAGNEGHFIRLVREAPADPGTVTARAVDALKKKIRRDIGGNEALEAAMDACAEALARNEMEKGAEALSELIVQLPPERFDATGLAILQDCAQKLKSAEVQRLEYILLALHTIEVGWQS